MLKTSSTEASAILLTEIEFFEGRHFIESMLLLRLDSVIMTNEYCLNELSQVVISFAASTLIGRSPLKILVGEKRDYLHW